MQSCLLLISYDVLALLVLSQDGPEMEKVNIQKVSRFCRKSWIVSAGNCCLCDGDRSVSVFRERFSLGTNYHY